jgi:hypothetical protein
MAIVEARHGDILVRWSTMENTKLIYIEKLLSLQDTELHLLLNFTWRLFAEQE